MLEEHEAREGKLIVLSRTAFGKKSSRLMARRWEIDDVIQTSCWKNTRLGKGN